MPYGWTNEQLDEAINRLREPLAEFEAAARREAEGPTSEERITDSPSVPGARSVTGGYRERAAQMRRMIERLEGMKTKEEKQA